MSQFTLDQTFQTALAHHSNGRLQQAEILYRQILAQQPNHADALHNLGAIALHMGHTDSAVDLFRRTIAVLPGYEEAHSNLGIALKEKGQVDEAIAAYRQALALKPDYPQAHNNLGNALLFHGQLTEAIAAFRQAIRLNPSYPDAHSNLVLAMHYHPAFDARTISREQAHWNHQHAEPLRGFIARHLNDRNPERRLRIGYVSGDFKDHPVGRFLLPLFARHDKNQVEVFAYSHVLAPDAITQRLRQHADCWRNIAGLSDSQAADLIRNDQIDVLVDLAGHTGGNRLLVFARKPAPVQATWLGYPDRTGLETMDYRLTDGLADPPEASEGLASERLASERLIRLPQTAWCFEAPQGNFPHDERMPSAATPLTFGSFNNFSKVTAPMLELWARILRSTPDSRLFIKAKALGSQSVIRRVREIMEAGGVASDRVELQTWRKTQEEHLAAYRQAHIALDTFPYHGTTTTCEAMWMGVPVVTLAGTSHVSRVGVSLLTNTGLRELIAQSEEEYVRIAIGLANDLPRLREVRSDLRGRIEKSSVMDAVRFAGNVEAAYRQMWRTYCAS
jgi:protein O-GlcNAc transferase